MIYKVRPVATTTPKSTTTPMTRRVSAPAPPNAISGRIEWSQAEAIVWFRPTPDYLRITPDGSFSMRHYVRDNAYMTYGTCR